MTIPFDLSKPEIRPFRLPIFTDDETGQWIADLAKTNGIEPSLVAHRILRAARDAAQAPAPEGERRQSERRSA